MEEPNGSGRVQLSLGILRGEMTSVQKDIARIEGKVDEGFESLRTEIQGLREDRSFAKGVIYIVTGLIAAVVSGFMILVTKGMR